MAAGLFGENKVKFQNLILYIDYGFHEFFGFDRIWIYVEGRGSLGLDLLLILVYVIEVWLGIFEVEFLASFWVRTFLVILRLNSEMYSNWRYMDFWKFLEKLGIRHIGGLGSFRVHF